MKKWSLALLLMMLLINFSCDKDSDNSPDPIDEGEELSMEEKARALILSLPAGDTGVVLKYIDPNQHIQHNHQYADGRDALIEAVLAGEFDNTQINIVRSLTDDNLVVLHSEYLIDGQSQVAFDVFRFEDGLIVEHWDNFQVSQPVNEAGHNMLDGPTEIADLDQTENNRTMVKDFISQVMIEGNYELMSEYLNEDQSLIQHNPMMADSLSGMLSMMDTLAAQRFSFTYDMLHQTIAMGDFVLTISEGQYGLESEPAAYYDLFRVEEGNLAEHWDVIQVIAPDEEWNNTNGKF
ncbi:MAG: hypothetical protein KDC80_11180 [Saprospiraceae bacterium]|nr:hypothetical protein [Saprospiraceae bacterium]